MLQLLTSKELFFRLLMYLRTSMKVAVCRTQVWNAQVCSRLMRFRVNVRSFNILHGDEVRFGTTHITKEMSRLMTKPTKWHVTSMGSQGPKLSSCGQRRLWSDWADVQADLSLRWAHMPFCWFCHEAAQMSKPMDIVYFCPSVVRVTSAANAHTNKMVCL